LDVTIPLTGSAGLRPTWQRRAIAIAWAGVAVVAVAASGDGSACPSVPGDREVRVPGVFAVAMRGAAGDILRLTHVADVPFPVRLRTQKRSDKRIDAGHVGVIAFAAS
jgi:hypothetical protein